MSTPVFNRSAQHKKGPPPVKRRPKKRQSAKHSQPEAIPTIAGQGTRGKSSFLNTLLQFDNDEAPSSNTGLRLQVEQDDPSNTLLGVRNLSDTSFTSRNYSNNSNVSNASSSAGELRQIQRQGEEIKRRQEENQRLLNRHKNNKKKFKPVRVEEEANTPLVPLGERVTPIYETDPSTPLLFYGGKKKKTRKKKTKRRRTKKKSLFKKKKIGKKRKKKKTKKRKTTRRKGRY